MSEKKKIVLDKKTLRHSWWNWICRGQICYNFERMMGLGFCHCMIPILKKLYPDDKEKRARGMSRHLTYYNTENTWGCLIPGIVAAMEGNPLGPILFVLVFSAYALGVGYTCYMTGYKMGKNAVVKILSGGLRCCLWHCSSACMRFCAGV